MHVSLPRTQPRLRQALLASLLTVLAGCTTVGPDYQTQAPNVPAHWIEADAAPPDGEHDGLRTWWRAFQDPLLDRLVDQALAHNQELDIALARLRQARAERVQIAAAAMPEVSIGVAGEAVRGSKALGSQPGGQARTWHLGFDASWELDLFGGTRRAVEAADAGIQALAEDHRALQVSLVAELVSDYAGLRIAQRRLAIAQDNIRTLAEAERLAEQAQRSGLGALADVTQARAEREMAEAQPPLLHADVARFSHAIGVLTGGFPGDWHAVLATPAPALPMPADLPLSLPSDVIRQRPDLRADERRLAAATAQIGVAQAARFPRFRIPLGIGTSASVIHDLFSGASLAWSAAMQGSHSLYDSGRARAGVTAAQANADAVRRVYERDVSVALRDVEDALTAWTSERQRQAALQKAVADSQQALQQASQLYTRGLSAYLPVLVAQRSLNQARDTLALSQLAQLQGGIALYKALGAGWSDSSLVPESEQRVARETTATR
ncbi:efflux transporter outer membrane subunit [Azoarcus indigens]|uniref:NodT family efflux transporter outer membrane factor (OMF) lipoprotein n=1 Tax=Azoarcus indigens TaxID=29545 RepID=A0A4R6DMU3_9RHOO|nr:efflux transporter outer membrane subunit [Azoarcus indigens]NMG65757.1 efflux transporter outer membrane subunit [Azoarcus indigens]TDN46113.1 NodT family efflux transporter outer membrane factor (OMF) lipoprotein [Azoarcus indigens]